ncbi:MAG: glycosyltransferase family protein [Alphaproteobacteria bacterium]|nr:glycosyltransferase family protein [Alphaproteobacteria bacterium]
MTIVAVIQARMTSTRLPGKILLPLAGRPILARVIERARAIEGVDRVVVAMPEGDAHTPIATLCATLNVPVVRGSEYDVLSRTLLAAESVGATIIMRLTSDCPFLDPAVSAAVLAGFRRTGVAYASNAMESGYPLGFDTQVTHMNALREADAKASDAYEREHVMPFLWRRPDRYPALYLDHRPNLRAWRLVVDTPEDYAMACAVYDALAPSEPLFDLAALRRLFRERPQLLTMNQAVPQTPYEGLPRA